MPVHLLYTSFICLILAHIIFIRYVMFNIDIFYGLIVSDNVKMKETPISTVEKRFLLEVSFRRTSSNDLGIDWWIVYTFDLFSAVSLALHGFYILIDLYFLLAQFACSVEALNREICSSYSYLNSNHYYEWDEIGLVIQK